MDIVKIYGDVDGAYRMEIKGQKHNGAIKLLNEKRKKTFQR